MGLALKRQTLKGVQLCSIHNTCILVAYFYDKKKDLEAGDIDLNNNNIIIVCQVKFWIVKVQHARP